MNKKGILMPLLAIFTLILMSYALYAFMVRDSDSDTIKGLGLLEGNLIKSNYAIEKGLFYDEKRIDVMLGVSFKEFIENRGFVDNSCTWWEFNSKCDPNLEENFLQIFESNTGYDAKFEDGKFIIDISREANEAGKNYNYSLSREIQVEKDFNLNNILALKQKIKECLGNDLESCIGMDDVVVKRENENIIFTMEINKKNLFFEPVILEVIIKDDTQKLLE